MSTPLIIIGNVSRDTVRYGGTERGSFWGGAGLNVALAVRQQGDKPGLLSLVGSDARDLLAELEGRVDVSRIKVLDGDSCRFDIQYSREGVLENIKCDFGVESFLNSYLEEAKLIPAHYHICCREPLNAKQIILRVKQRGFTFSLDFIQSSIQQKLEQVKDLLQYAKFVFLNSQELRIWERICSVDRIATLVVTSSNQPVRVLEFGREVLNQECPPKKFFEVTGAGDVFAGTFLAAQFVGMGLSESVTRAISCSQQSLDNYGVMHFLR